MHVLRGIEKLYAKTLPAWEVDGPFISDGSSPTHDPFARIVQNSIPEQFRAGVTVAEYSEYAETEGQTDRTFHATDIFIYPNHPLIQPNEEHISAEELAQRLHTFAISVLDAGMRESLQEPIQMRLLRPTEGNLGLEDSTNRTPRPKERPYILFDTPSLRPLTTTSVRVCFIENDPSARDMLDNLKDNTLAGSQRYNRLSMGDVRRRQIRDYRRRVSGKEYP